MNNQQFSDLVTCLCGDQRPRVWSLLVTVFGELAQDDNARISGAMLRHLSDLIGLKPEAVRVALHRLRKENWIESHRSGRNSDYSLTDWGRAQSAAASPRIYATRALVDHASLVVLEPGHAMSGAEVEGVFVSSNLLITSRHAASENAFSTPLEVPVSLPDWMTRKLLDEGILQYAEKFDATLAKFNALLNAENALGPHECAVLRILVVHGWRRIALKTPILPDYVFPDTWPIKRCRQKVFEVLQKIPPTSLQELEAQMTDVNGATQTSKSNAS